MKNLMLFLPLLLLFCAVARGQNAGEFSIHYIPGRASFGMSDLIELYTDAHAQLPFRPRITANFPAYYEHQFQLLYSPVKNLKLGLSYGSTSTGARSTYSDYPGTYYFDQPILPQHGGCWGSIGWEAGKISL